LQHSFPNLYKLNISQIVMAVGFLLEFDGVVLRDERLDDFGLLLCPFVASDTLDLEAGYLACVEIRVGRLGVFMI
jgi:hypothetical protein